MSDLESQIRISADASGVEAGVGKAKKSLADLGKAASDAGRQAAGGLAGIGAGADGAARNVEASTRSMQSQLQRLVISLEAGSKASSEFYRNVAQQRGLNLAALEPFIARLQEFERKTELAAEAKRRLDTAVGDLRAIASLTGALASLTVVAGALSFANSIKGAIEQADALNKLSQRTGVAVEALSQLQFAAKLSDVSTESLSSGLKKLNVSISEGLGGNKEKLAIFKSLGIDLRDAAGNAKTADKVLRELSDSFAGAKDGAAKTAIAVGLLGKAGDELIPLLNGGSKALEDLATKADRLGITISTEFAAKAEQFNDDLTILKASSDKLAISLGGDLVAGLGDVTKKMAEAAETSGKWKAIMVGLDAIGNKFLDWDGTQLRKQIKWTEDDVKTLRAQLSAPIVDLFGQKGELEAQLNAKIALLQKLREEYYKFSDKAGAGRGFVNPAVVQPDKGDLANPKPATTDTLSEYDALIKRIKERISVQSEELRLGRAVTEEDKFAAKVLADMAQAKQALTGAQKAYVESLLKESAARFEALRQQKEELKAIAELNKFFVQQDADLGADQARRDNARYALVRALNDQELALEESNEQLALEARLIGATDEQRRIAIENLRIEQNLRRADLADRNNLSLDEETREAARRKRQQLAAVESANITTKEVVEKWKQAAEEINSALTNAIADWALNGKSLGKGLANALKQEFERLVLRPQISAALNSTGLPQFLGAQTAGNAGGAYNMANGATSVGSAFMAGFSGTGAAGAVNVGTATAADISLMYAGSEGVVASTTASVMAGAEAALAAIPVAGWIALGAMVLSQFLGDSHGPKAEGGFGPKVDNRGDTGAAQQFANTISGSYTSLATLLGATKTKLDDISVFFAKDPNGTAQTQLAIAGGSYDRGTLLGGVENVGRSDKEFQDAVSLASAQLIIKNLQEQVSGPIGDYLKGIDITTASLDTLNTALQAVQDVGTFTTAVKGLGPAFASLTSLSVDATEALVTSLGGAQSATALVGSFFGDFFTEAEKHDVLLGNLTSTFAEANVQLPKTREEFKSAFTAAMSAGDTDTLSILLKTAGAFNQLYPAIEATGDAASEAAAATNTWLTDYIGRITKSDEESRSAAKDAIAAAQQSAREWASLKANIASGTLQSAVDAAQQAYTDSLASHTQTVQQQSEALAQSVAGLNSFADSLKKLRESLDASAQGGLTPGGRYDAARNALAGATAETAPELVRNFLDLAKDQAGSSLDYRRDVAYAKSILAGLEDSSRKQAVAIQAGLNASQNAAQFAAYAKLQLAQLNQSTYGASPDQAAPLYDSLIQGLFGQSGMAREEFERWAREVLNLSVSLPSYDVGTSYVPRTGPAIVHQGEAIIPAALNRAGFGSEESVALLRDVRSQLASIAGHSNRGATASEKTERHILAVVSGNQSFTTVPA